MPSLSLWSCLETASAFSHVWEEFARQTTEVESRTQGSRSRPRTQKNSAAKAKDTKKLRGQGQGQPFRVQTLSRPRTRTKDTAASVLQKKGLQKSFSGDLQFIGVPRIFDWGRPKPQITCNDVIKNFQKRKFLWAVGRFLVIFLKKKRF